MRGLCLRVGGPQARKPRPVTRLKRRLQWQPLFVCVALQHKVTSPRCCESKQKYTDPHARPLPPRCVPQSFPPPPFSHMAPATRINQLTIDDVGQCVAGWEELSVSLLDLALTKLAWLQSSLGEWREALLKGGCRAAVAGGGGVLCDFIFF